MTNPHGLFQNDPGMPRASGNQMIPGKKHMHGKPAGDMPAQAHAVHDRINMFKRGFRFPHVQQNIRKPDLQHALDGAVTKLSVRLQLLRQKRPRAVKLPRHGGSHGLKRRIYRFNQIPMRFFRRRGGTQGKMVKGQPGVPHQ